jgi:hypothetical protein
MSERGNRGSVVMMLLLVLGALGAMLGALAVRGAQTELRAAGAGRTGRAGFYCAEAGLESARAWFAANYALWGPIFSGQSVPGYPITGDLDDDGGNDYVVTLQDDVDEFPPLANDPTRDENLTAIMVSRCVNPTMGGRQLEEIVRLNAKGTNYRLQSGHGSNHAGNED